MSPLVFIAFSTVFSISAHLSLKHGMSRMNQASGFQLIRQMMLSPWLVGGLFVYGLGVIFWLLALSRLDVSFVYPFASLATVGVILGSYFLFKENITRMRMLGIVVIIAGVLIIGWGA